MYTILLFITFILYNLPISLTRHIGLIIGYSKNFWICKYILYLIEQFLPFYVNKNIPKDAFIINFWSIFYQKLA